MSRGPATRWEDGVHTWNLHLMLDQCRVQLSSHMCDPSTYEYALGEMVWSNLPGWRWATIMQVVLDRLSRSLHSDVCDSDGCRDAVAHSRISGRGIRRPRAAPNHTVTKALICR